MTLKQAFYSIVLLVGFMLPASSQVNVDVNVNIKHSVGGVSDFGRERHITVHANITEPGWEGEEAKMNYLMNDLDVYFGRDNGRATFHFGQTPVDPNRDNYPNIDSMRAHGDYWNTQHENLGATRLAYEARATEMIMGTNPHPTYPTLSWYDNGYTSTDPKWQPLTIQTSADWVVEYLDNYFAKNTSEDGPQLPKYWEVINEPDMLMMTGQFMVTSQEKIWEYHNLVADGVKQRLGNKAPLIGGMTWGLHDFFKPDGISRYAPDNYDQWITDPAGQQFYRDAAATAYYTNRNDEWYQWDVMWKGFIDAAGANMDFYAVHIYDWPEWESDGGAIRAGGHTEAMLDMIEWYDQYKFGSRKPIVLSEYGAVSNYIEKQGLDPDRRDWENLKPFSSMLMQFLERPDYIVKSMPFTPIKAEWGDWRDANGNTTNRYPYTMMDDNDGDGNWEWSKFILWYELWADVEGTRVDTKAGDRDIQVDAYINGDKLYLILNNLERNSRTLKLNFFGTRPGLQNVRIKHLYLNGNMPTLSNTTQNSAPSTVSIGAEATMILCYDYSSNVTINQTSNERKYMGQPLNSSAPYRQRVQDGTLTANINGVSVPSKGEAMLRLCGNFYWDHITQTDSRNSVTVNGHSVALDNDWRGEKQGTRNTFFGVLEIPVPLNYLNTNNTITAKFLNVCDYTNVSMQVWDMSVEPGRSSSSSSSSGGSSSGGSSSGGSSSGGSSSGGSSSGGSSSGGSSSGSTTTISGNSSVIEAESLNATGGTFNDGQVTGGGVNVANNSINWVNAGDWAEYSINATENATYQIVYSVSTPQDNAQVTIKRDGTTISADNVVNNGAWDSYQNLTAANNMSLTTGNHTIRIEATGSNDWQWNMDKITLNKVTSSSSGGSSSGGSSSGGSSSGGSSSGGSSSGGSSSGGQTAYPSGTPHAIPGTINSVDFDNGGEGVAYHDATSGNSGSGARQDTDVDTEARIAAGNVGWVATGEWLEYTVNVASTGTYTITTKVASTGNNGKYHIEFNGTDKTGVQSVSATGGWGTFVNNTVNNVSLNAGQQVMRIYMDGGSFNLGPVSITGSSSSSSGGSSSGGSSSGGSSSGGSSSGGSSSGGSSSGGTNLALNKPATQSSDYNSNFQASKAVDGTITGTDGDFNHTKNDANAWWQVDLQSVSDITSIEVYNRTNCCQNRLSNFYVFVSDNAFTSTNLTTTRNQSGVSEYHTSGQAGSPTTINVNRSGRYVRVQLAGTNFLHMAEVVVNGTAGTGSSSSGGSSSGGSSSGCSGTVITVEAENLSDHGGTYNDGHVPVGVGVAAGVGINWVNNGDWAEYNVNVPATGTYQLVYNIGTPLANRSIKMSVDGTNVGTTSVPNTGNWETYQNVTASSNVSLTAGNRVIRIESGTTDTWTWNLNKFTFTCTAKEAQVSIAANLSDIKIYPNPADDVLNIELPFELDNDAQVIIYNNIGRAIAIDQISDSYNQISLSDLSAGMYILQVVYNDEVVTKRFAKK